jgi:hypothetical protein
MFFKRNAYFTLLILAFSLVIPILFKMLKLTAGKSAIFFYRIASKNIF